MNFLILISLICLFSIEINLIEESNASSLVSTISRSSISLGFNTPKIPGNPSDSSCKTMSMRAIENIKLIQEESNSNSVVKQCYIKAMFYDFNDNDIIRELRAAKENGVNIEFILDRDQLIKSVSKPYNLNRNEFLREIPITIIGTPYRTGNNKRILHHKSSLFYCIEEGNLTESTILLGSYNWTYGGANYNFESCISIDNPGREFNQLLGQFETLSHDRRDLVDADDVDPDVRKYTVGTDWMQDPSIRSSLTSISASAETVVSQSSRKKPRDSAVGEEEIHEDSRIDVAEAEWFNLRNWNIKHKGDGTTSYSRDVNGIQITVFFKWEKWKYVRAGEYGHNFNTYQEAMQEAYSNFIK